MTKEEQAVRTVPMDSLIDDNHLHIEKYCRVSALAEDWWNATERDVQCDSLKRRTAACNAMPVTEHSIEGKNAAG